MQNKENKKEFDTFGFVKRNLLKGYFKTKDQKIQECEMNGIYQFGVFYWLNKNGAVKIISHETREIEVDGIKKYKTTVRFKELNLEAKAKNKENKEYNIFSYRDINNAKALLFDEMQLA